MIPLHITTSGMTALAAQVASNNSGIKKEDLQLLFEQFLQNIVKALEAKNPPQRPECCWYDGCEH
jgi:enamine deaminase RidA (YjgF/YER057c/UK114 family)